MKEKIYIFVPLFLIGIILYSSLAPVIEKSEDISEKVFRLHIIANSNSEADQSLKLKVRDQIINYSEKLYKECKSLNEAVNRTNIHLNDIKNTAQKTVAFYGYEYEIKAYTSREFFNVREYDGFTLPAGVYKCLKIIIGEGKGKNWWCVMFPSVCLSGCTDDFDKTLSEDERRMLENKKYIVKFKAVEIYERLKCKIGA